MSVGGLRIILAVPHCKVKGKKLRSESRHQSDCNHLGCYVVFSTCVCVVVLLRAWDVSFYADAVAEWTAGG
jgi:hypothetical protein